MLYPRRNRQKSPMEWGVLMRNTPKDRLLEVFQAACKDIPPLLHRYFLERFPDPAVWYTRRLAYTASIAVSSIVGYVVGLGDRHLTNLLIDVDTSEIVHIDLGVAFDLGRVRCFLSRC